MRAVDTNVLVYAEVTSAEQHDVALEVLTELAEANRPWALPWPCAYEFLRIVTHHRVFDPPTPLDVAVADLGSLLASPSLQLLSETPRHFEVLEELLGTAPVSGNLIHDAHIAALCIEHGVDELITGDNDFRRFGQLEVTNPFAP